MKFTNKLDLPQALADAVSNDPYDNGGAWRSVTQLIAPPRQVALRKKHEEEIEEDVSERLYSLYGQIVHSILERSNTKDLAEGRLCTECFGKKISGGYDVLQLADGRLSDWKFSTVWKAKGDNEDWVAQVNLLALLFRIQKVEIKELQVILLMRDHSKPKARREPDYPQLPVQKIPIPLWSEDEQMRYLETRVKLHLAAEEKLPLCTPAERWTKPSIYAVMKKGRKSAVKLHDEKASAEEAITAWQDPAYYLEVRSGESTRCLDYCNVSKFCKQNLEEKF